MTTCGACGHGCADGAKFCAECGAPVGDAACSATAERRPLSDPRTYTPKHLAEKILRSKPALEGE